MEIGTKLYEKTQSMYRTQYPYSSPFIRISVSVVTVDQRDQCTYTDNGDRSCAVRHIYKEKCVEILAYKPHRKFYGKHATNDWHRRRGARRANAARTRGRMVQAEAAGKVAHSNCESDRMVEIVSATYGQSCGATVNNAFFAMSQACNGHPQCHYYLDKEKLGDVAKGCPKNFVWQFKCVKETEDSRSGSQSYHEVDGVGYHLRPTRWDNTFCHRKRVPICQKPRGEVFAGYIGVRAARTYQQASQWCQTWYGTSLATILSDEDGQNAQRACQKLDIMNKKHCWIGLHRESKGAEFKEWDAGEDIKPFENWAPGQVRQL